MSAATANDEISRLRTELHTAQEDARGARECARQDGVRLAWWQDQFASKTGQQTMLIADELRALRAEVEALREDAARYRFLRHSTFDEESSWCVYRYADPLYADPATLDADIDAARAKEST